MSDGRLIVSEIFGPTFQGEGPSTGRRAAFLRLGRCPLACSWCDTPFTWDWTRFDPAVELREMSLDAVSGELRVLGTELLVISGGEPLVQQTGIAALLRILDDEVEIETAGIVAPQAELVTRVDRFNVSPKLANSGNPLERRYKPDVLRAFQSTGKAAFKFVVADATELDEVQSMVDECGLTNVWIMPEGTTATAVEAGMRTLADPVTQRGWNLSTRLHVILWGDERGR